MSRAAVDTPARRVLDEPVCPHVADDLAGHLRTHGMYPPRAEWRQGAAAFTVRDDLSLENVLESISDLLRMAESAAAVLARDENADAHISGAAEAIGHVLKQARGLQSLVFPALIGLSTDWPQRVKSELLAPVPEAPSAGGRP